MNNKARHILFILFAVLAFAALLYHIIAVVQPFDATPAWRHTLFMAISTICIYGLLKRPSWFIWFFGLLLVQQLYSHGTHFFKLLEDNKINSVDIAVLLLTPILFLLLLTDKSNKQKV
jgi:hypothetical protein